VTRAWLPFALALAACTSAPPPRPVIADALLPEVAPSAAGSELLATLRRAAAAGHRADVLALAGSFAGELAAVLASAGGDDLAVAAAIGGDAAALVSMPAPAGSARDDVGRHLHRCRDALRVGDHEDAAAAAAAAGRAAAEGRAQAATHLWSAYVAAAAGDDTAAQQFATAVAAMAPFGPCAVVRAELVAMAATGDPAAWQRAVDAATAAVQSNPRLADPWAWRRALELQPAARSWPAAADAALAATVPELRGSGDLAPTTAAWFAIGEQHRRRDEPLAALVAFRRVEELANGPLPKALAQVGQARALLAGGRSGDARAVLEPSLRSDDEAAKACAVAMLAALELAAERPAVARQLLEQALGPAGDRPFPLRGSALVNRGIACCLLGDAEAGQRALAAARAVFQAQRDVAGYALALANEELCAREYQRGDLREILRLQDELRTHGLP
jgi:hypothetical protein